MMTRMPEVRYVSIHGQPVAYRTMGEGPVLVLVHGMAGSGQTWAHVMPTLARRFTVVAPDLLGHGDSAKPKGEYSISGHANVLRDVLLALGHERATLVGQSFGGGVVMQLAYQYPERCERLVLVSSGGLGREVSGLLRGLAVPGVERLFPLVCSPALRNAGTRLMAWLGGTVRPAPAIAEAWRSYASLADPDTRQAFFRTLQAVIDAGGQRVSATDRLYLAAMMPTLIVWGAHDALIPVEHGIAAHDAIPGSRLEIFEDTGHFPHCEAPERFVETLLRFIDSTEPASEPEQTWRDLLRRRTLDGSQPEGERP
jgi:pimeloyl-ACP methyl ester carboxylesterase